MFRDRQHGGRLLARALGYVRAEAPVVVGVARGGVPVALEVAKALGAPLDVVAAQKLGAAEFPEFTVAAVAEGGAVHVRQEVLRELGVADADVAAQVERAAVELAQRARGYRGGAPPPDLAGRTALVVDDGAATGATASAAARAVRARGAARVLFAAPVIAEAAAPLLRRELDEVVALDWPRAFVAIGIWYERFERVPDEEVVECVRRGAEQLARPEADRPWAGAAPQEAAAERPAVPGGEVLAIPCEGASPGFLEADLVVPDGATGIVLFGTGSTRESPRYRLISRALQRMGIATLRCELLTPAEQRAARASAGAGLLASRVATVIRWAAAHPATRLLHRGLYGAGTGAEVVLAAVAQAPELVEAVVVRAGRLDAVPTPTLERITAPVLLVVGSRDENVLSANRAALAHLSNADLAVVPGATDLFGEPGALEAVARLAADWCQRWLERAAAGGGEGVA